jgi:hypothetical protein
MWAVYGRRRRRRRRRRIGKRGGTSFLGDLKVEGGGGCLWTGNLENERAQTLKWTGKEEGGSKFQERREKWRGKLSKLTSKICHLASNTPFYLLIF